MADATGARRGIKWMGQPARGTIEAEAMRMRDEPGLGRGGEGTVRPRPCRGVSDKAENEQLGSPAVAETIGTWT